MNLKDKIEEKAFNFEDEDGTFENSTIFLTDLFEIPEIKQLLIQLVDNLLFCGKCGNKRELIVETNINSGRTCKSRLCNAK